MKKLISIKILILTIIALALPVHAQIEEVIVTANKREQSVQDVSVAVTALTSDDIARAGIDDITGLETVVPGLRIGTSGGEVRPALRGARTNEVGVAGTGIAEQVIGIFQDGIYLPTTTAGLGAYVDIERIEVLRGPQGTLFGRNTFAGSINIITKQPEFDELGGSIKLTTGSYDRTAYDGVLNIPHSSVLASRVVLSSDRHDGMINNLVQEGPSDDLRERNRHYFRLTTKYQPSDRMSFTFRLDHSNRNANSEAIWGYQQIAGYSILAASTKSAVVDGDEEGTTKTITVVDQYNPNPVVAQGHIYQPGDAKFNDLGPEYVYRNALSIDRQNATSVSLILENAFSALDSKITLNHSILKGRQYYDSDYSDGGTNFVGGFGRDDDQTSTSLEIQLTSNTSGPLEWVAGLYYFTQDAGWGWVSSADTRGDGVADSLVVPGWGSAGLDDPHTVTSLAFYGQATYSISDGLRIVAGLRQNSDEKTFTGDIEDWDDSDPLFKFALEVDVSDNQMAYATIATGLRTGGANDGRVVSRGANPTYDNEIVTNIELGLKSKLMADTMILNIALFNNSYEDVKAQLFALACSDAADTRSVGECVSAEAATTFEYYQNGGTVDSTGLEVELDYRPIDDFRLTAGIAYLDSTFADDYRIGSDSIQPLFALGNLEGRQDVNSTTDRTFSFAGWRPALSPELTINFGLVYTMRLDNGTIWEPSIRFSNVSEYYSFDVNIPETKQDAHTIIDAKLSWMHEQKDFQVDFFVKNLTDEVVLRRSVVHTQRVNNLPVNSVQANWSDPMTWGVSFKQSF